jgi:hypothetical protein
MDEGDSPMAILTKPSSAPGTSLSYITIGTLMAIWSAVWYFVARPETQWTTVICLGLFLTGVSFLIIGFGVGQIGRAARSAELPPPEATPAVAGESQMAAASRAPQAQGPAPVPQTPSNTVIQT